MEKQKIAVIDLGTNTFHLLIVSIDSYQRFHIIHRERKAVMIGRGGINQGMINEEAQLRALSTVQHFKDMIDKFKIDHVVATATSAFRNAKNGASLAKRIYDETSISIDIIPGELEADYIYYGVREAMALEAENALIMDIGGGSVEFIICNDQFVLWKQSYEIGAQRLLELFDITDPISRENVEQLLQYFDNKLLSLTKAVKKFQPKTLIGASGTFDTLSDIYVIDQDINVKPDASELPLTYEHYLKTHQALNEKNHAERMTIPGMIELRADMIVVASWLIHYVLDKYQIRNIRVSAFALKEGLLRCVSNQLIANQ
ncbi:exopolyphosphatase/guanosine-5'-triphosphate,3'-diphosphate pyrophosphatase [Catalinimonas alkaloidigena]|uniref:Ppx/GppA phosphatase family protein n=1 Tax=Catalinimonas alkaloidigena TaxID=1075417 RepID=UPI002404D59D|nr:exopolyphosphatase [Catalinimonas alkaloidigena]MDF9795578.1 exopolyphosphatase/guanosine-5'-triphosphate,3'-diphosphate pyrophosphatase [Catalinimonas alkaloidigena]